VMALGFLLMVSLVLSAALAAVGTYLYGIFPGIRLLLQIANFAISFALISLLFAAIYKFLPDTPIEWRDVTTGAVVTALLFTIGKTLIGLYIGSSKVASSYGAAGALIVILLWIYYSAQIFLLGAEFAYESYWNQNYYRAGTCNGVPLQTPLATNGYTGCVPAGFTTGSASPGNVAQQYGNLATAQAYTAAGYFNDTVQVLPELKLVGGLRFDYYYAQIGNSQNSANIFGNTTLPYAAQAITNTSVRAGAIFEPTRAQSYYFSYSTSFNPSLEQLVTTTGTSQPLPPEQNEAFEAGVKYEFLNGNLSVNAAAFQITKTNARSQNTDGTFSATGTVRVKGVRTGVTGRITPEWQVFGGYAYLDGRIIDGIGAGTSGNVPLNTPRDSATLWTTYTFRETYEIGGGATYIGYRYANNTNSVSVPDFTRLDMTAAYRQPAYDVRVNIFNLTNVMYYEQVIASDGGRAVPGSGLTAMLTYTHHL